jgi:hypothetical protein
VAAVMLGFSAQVMADDDDDGRRHGHGWHDRDDDDDDGETWIFLGDPGFQGGNSWGGVPQGCRVERRWDDDGDYREQIDCRGPSHSPGWTSVPVLRAPSLNIIIPIN